MADENENEDEEAKEAGAEEGGEGGDADADAAAEWESMLAEGEGEGGEGGEGETDAEAEARVLNQDEIDSLLGFEGEEGDGNSGIKALLDKALNTYDRLPMLEVVFDRLVRMMSTSMRNFTSDNVDISIDSITSLRFGDYLNSIPLPALLVVFKAIEWENFGIITVDGSLIYSMVDVLLGGRRSNRPIRIEGRPYTTIEQDIVKQMSDVMLQDMGAAFDPLSPVTFQFDRLETNPRFATIARPANAAVLVRLRVDMEDRGGNIEILLPYATLEPIKDLLLQMFMGEKFGQDTTWEAKLGNEVGSANMDMTAILTQKKMSLGDVTNFQVGKTVLLDSDPEDEVIVSCGDVPVFSGRLGKAGDHLAIRVTQMLVKQAKEEA